MFPHDISRIALVAIEYSEWHSLDYLLNELFSWMDAPDQTTAVAVNTIVRSLFKKVKGNSNLLSLYNDRIQFMVRYVELTFGEQS